MHKLWLSYLPRYLPFDYCLAVRRGTEILLANHKRHYTPEAGCTPHWPVLWKWVKPSKMRFAVKSLKKPVFASKIFAISVANLGHSLIHKWWSLADYDCEIQLQKQNYMTNRFSSATPFARITANILSHSNATLELCKAEQNK